MGAVSLAGARCLVTGGAGTIGSAVVDGLLRAGAARVTVLDDFSRGRRANLEPAGRRGLRVVEGDVRDRALVDRLMPGTDAVFHLAALRITRCAAEPRLALGVLVDGTFEVAEAAAEAGAGRLVFSSSASVYGAAEEFPTPESHHPWADDTLYGSAKAFGEGMLRSLAATRGLDAVCLRYFNVYGPRMDVHGRYTEVLVRWMERIAAGRPPLLLGGGAQTLDLVHVADVARANLAAAKAELGPGAPRAFNVGAGAEVPLRELAGRLAAAMGAEGIGVEHGPARGAGGGVPRRRADTALARAALGWKPEIGLDEGLRGLVAWWRSATKGARS
ncbi:NAD-dependent epimerase [Mangrovactinospora gilvigrisea]|uniref:NAD-dependent epimerase n=1 Tax=Mangrovactinospora gilvigrisea TaxID=1428644 RepID=A0A1J7CBG5_9ACTN|nr:NAD-dependent epimerase/dehydratase family protein [Mangrovactinospora gilvigrisea]OIV38860.1 NAD-dependent epimerase [Mangrovactinospora gilvigrisea]